MRIELRPSRRLACALATAHLASGTLVVLSGLEAWLAAAACAVLALSACHHVRRDALLLAARSVLALELRGEAECVTHARAPGSARWKVCGSTYAARWLVVLALAAPVGRARRHVVLLPDGMSADAYRRLVVWLRWSAATRAPMEPENRSL